MLKKIKGISTTAASPIENEEELQDEKKNILLNIISQLRVGMDLSKVTLPTFVLEPKSMLERITNFMSHPELLLPIPTIQDPVQRFVEVCKFYLSGWHIKPAGVKKPLNPVLGEHFRCFWIFPDQNYSVAMYLAEQVSHHPPISAYFYIAPEQRIRIDGVLKPRSRFLGNSAGTIMEGKAILKFLDYEDESYTLTQPNMYARGILFGSMKFELGDHAYIYCEKNKLSADIDFKTKGFIGGTYNAIHGKIKDEVTGETLYEITGKWDSVMYLHDVKAGTQEVFIDSTKAKPSFGMTRPFNQQEQKESQRLWRDTCEAIVRRDQEAATEYKSAIEDNERAERRERELNNQPWQTRFFKHLGGEEYILDLELDANLSSAETIKQIEEFATVFPLESSNQQEESSSASQTTSEDKFMEVPELSEAIAQIHV